MPTYQDELLKKAQAMLRQTQAQGNTPFAGSTYDSSATRVTPYAPTAPTPVTTLPTQPVKSNLTYTETPEEKALREATARQSQSALEASNQTINEDQIRADVLAQMQAEINAQNSVFADKLSRAQVEGAGRLGSTGAIQARRGLLGSDFGASQTQGVVGANEAIYGSIENEKQAVIQSLLSKGRDMGARAIAEKRAAKEAGLSEYIKSLGGAVESAKSRAKELATVILQSGTIDQYDPASIEQVAKDAGVTVSQIKSAYDEQKKLKDAEALKLKTDAEKLIPKGFDLSEGQSRYEINPQTGKYEQVANVPKTFAPVRSGVAPTAGTGTGLAGVPADIQSAAQSIFDGKSKLNEYPSGMRLQINQAFSKLYSATGGNELAQGAYDAVNTLEKHPGFGGAIGTNWLFGFGKNISGSASAGFLAELDKLKANIKLINIKYLKGTGALSDAEGATLENAGTSLNPQIPEADFKSELTRIKKILLKSNNIDKGGSGNAVIGQSSTDNQEVDDFLNSF
jgi:hypothetical protein